MYIMQIGHWCNVIYLFTHDRPLPFYSACIDVFWRPSSPPPECETCGLNRFAINYTNFTSAKIVLVVLVCKDVHSGTTEGHYCGAQRMPSSFTSWQWPSLPAFVWWMFFFCCMCLWKWLKTKKHKTKQNRQQALEYNVKVCMCVCSSTHHSPWVLYYIIDWNWGL